MSDTEDPFDTASRLRIVGAGFAFIGTCFVVAISCLAITHYGYGSPVHMRRSYRLASEGLILFSICLFGLVGIGAVVAGLAMRGRAARIEEQEYLGVEPQSDSQGDPTRS